MDADARVLIGTNQLATDSNLTVSISMRQGALDGPYYEAVLRFKPDQSADINLSRHDTDEDISLDGSGTVEGIHHEVGGSYWFRSEVTGSSPTTFRAKLWVSSATEPPDWAVQVTDAAPELQSAGAVGLRFYVGASQDLLPVAAHWDMMSIDVPTQAPESPRP
jgi:hypothetical protein